MMKTNSNNTIPPGFKVPKGYFDNFKVEIPESALPEKDGLTVPDTYFKELKEKLTTSTALPGKPGFKTPNGYFSDFKVNVPKKEVKVFGLFSKNALKFAGIAAAASLVLFVFLKDLSLQPEQVDFNALSAAEIENWFIENPGTVSSDELAENLTESSMIEKDFLSEEELTDYLMNTDIETLMTENQ